MEVRAKNDTQAIRQLPKLKSLLKKYREVKTMQSGLLQLSELASTVTDMDSFYPALNAVIENLFITDAFHIALLNQSRKLTLTYCNSTENSRLVEQIDSQNWHQTLTGIVFENAEAMHCSSAERMALAKAGKIVLYGSACVDWLGVPLKRGHQVIGVIALQSYDSKLYFDDRDCQLLEFIGEHIVTAIDRVTSRELLEQNIRQRTQKLTETNHRLQLEIAERQKVVKVHKALLAISELTAMSEDINLFYRTIHGQIETLLPAKNLYIALLSEKGDMVHFTYYHDEKIAHPQPRRFATGLTELAVKTGKPLLISQGKIHTLGDDGEFEQQAFNLKYPLEKLPKAWLGAPLIDRGKIIGVLAIQHYHDSEAYQLSDLKIIRFVGQHIATAILRKTAQDNIQRSKSELEKIVSQRTEELQASNLNLRMQIEERKKAEEQLYYEAHHDALTKLPNRAMFSDRLAFAQRHLKRHPNNRFAVLFIDLDRFKIINDTLGHLAGDNFLIEIANRLSECVRDNDILARLGGDEFVILLDSLQSQDDVEEVASRIINAVSKPFELDGHCLYSNASIGIALCSQHYKDSNEILRDADAAMYQAKSLGRGRYVFFDESMREQLIASMTLEQELRIAIKEEQFELHYQQISDLMLTNTIGFEALLRWKHPTKGILTPSEFLYMAEETGMILDIETWVISQVCSQLKSWLDDEDEHQNAFIGVNLSGRHLTQANQLNKLIGLIKDHTVEPERLILEFNESAFSKNNELALKGLRKLKELGVKLALDDYGAGQSSFNFLHNYPFEFIKLDRSFIRTLNGNDKNLSLVKALHELGGKFGYRLVAEGIESEEVLQKLMTVGCDFGQGYHISRPEKIVNKSNVQQLKPQARA
ncbi:bifunctional diguanylate cyclase/phosphodiesterase [Thalassotalea profundi]|uniref:Bifunctional diguanylate cyclase/phosphodiesterase n=1 Tax=Thalassotalea profundi TaxID=2036687 RepID=A0ABQ3IZ10_9GAMM|nr:EAL domain-containing protein [Thalassotalea profundi]GHE95646.1 bifunctional diguanylate cyclase/phosphodiesterase [Thalassotalea profundi]